MVRSKKFRDLLIRLALVIGSIVFSFLIIEVILRVGFRDTVLLFPRYHTDAHYGDYTIRKILPNTVFWHTSLDGTWKFTTNKQGFRNFEDFEYTKPEGVIRIVALGDSHTQGYEVRQEHTYSAVIEKYLTQKGYQVEVMNAGVSGFGTSEELVLLENEIVKYKPDFVIVGFYKNDFEDSIRSDLFVIDSKENLVVKNKEYIPGVQIQNLIYKIPFTHWLGENSYAYSFIFNSVWDFYKNISRKNAQDAITEYAIPTQTEATNYQVLYTTKLFERMYRFCQNHAIKLIIADIPIVKGDVANQQSRSSFPLIFVPFIEKNSDVIIKSDDLLADYQGVADIFVQHGAYHIGEFTHTLIGVAISREIEKFIQ